MGELADRLDRMRVRASTPGGDASAELCGRADLRLWFAPGYFRGAAARDLERALGVLARLLAAARAREVDAAIRAAGGDPRPRGRSTDPRDLAYHDGLDALVARGAAADGSVRLRVCGMRDWTVEVRPGRLREAEFAARVAEAAAALIEDQLDQVRRLRHRVYRSRPEDGWVA